MIRFALTFILSFLAASAHAGSQVDVMLLGEIHDNPTHHAVQAGAVVGLAPRALVFEMLTEKQAALVTPELRADPQALGEALDWEGAGWPDFAMYAPIFTAAPKAQIYGAGLMRGWDRLAMMSSIEHIFGPNAEGYGLTEPLDPEQMAERLNLQMAAHCNALPLDLLPGMVDVQRLRDAMLARVALRALKEIGGPVAVISGNGHARKDWGLPSYIARVAPDLRVFVLGQSEDGVAPEGGFDLVLDAPGVARDDPCEAFR